MIRYSTISLKENIVRIRKGSTLTTEGKGIILRSIGSLERYRIPSLRKGFRLYNRNLTRLSRRKKRSFITLNPRLATKMITTRFIKAIKKDPDSSRKSYQRRYQSLCSYLRKRNGLS